MLRQARRFRPRASKHLRVLLLPTQLLSSHHDCSLKNKRPPFPEAVTRRFPQFLLPFKPASALSVAPLVPLPLDLLSTT